MSSTNWICIEADVDELGISLADMSRTLQNARRQQTRRILSPSANEENDRTMAEETYDPRREALVMETRTFWDADVGNLSEQDRTWLSKAVHAAPDKAAKISYDRGHTGFARQITVTVADIERLYREKMSS